MKCTSQKKNGGWPGPLQEYTNSQHSNVPEQYFQVSLTTAGHRSSHQSLTSITVSKCFPLAIALYKQEMSPQQGAPSKSEGSLLSQANFNDFLIMWPCDVTTYVHSQPRFPNKRQRNEYTVSIWTYEVQSDKKLNLMDGNNYQFLIYITNEHI